ncbi:MAG: glycosyltransferase [Dysgonomonas sp.]|nr:glycosyltransferase [Dysgonomonas sp.]
MKILQINKYPSLKGGTETVLFETIDLLKEKGHEVVLFSTDEGRIEYTPTFTIPYVRREASLLQKIKKLPSFFYNNKAAKDLIKILEVEKPDIAHIHLYLNSFSVSILPILKRYRIPVVMTLHEYRQICPSYLLMDKDGNICERCKKGNYLNCMLTRCAKGSFLESSLLTLEMYYRRLFYPTEKYVDKFICVSDFVLEKHQEFNPSISKKSVTIKNPVISHEKVEKKQGGYLLFVGRLSKEKGLSTLLEAIKDFPNIKLKMVGIGESRYDENLPNVEFLGFRDKKQIQELIKGAWYTVIPTRSYETFGLSCAESLSLSTPVIASRIGALPELVRDGENGFLFTPKNVVELKSVIRKAISLSDKDYDEMSERAFISVQELSGDNYINKLLDLYNGLLENKV